MQHHIPFHTEFFSPSHLNPLRLLHTMKLNAQFNASSEAAAAFLQTKSSYFENVLIA